MYFAFYKMMHIISFTAWFAGTFYIWRLFVYHAETEHQEVRDTLSVMERKLIHYIMWPSMISTILFGILLLIQLWSIHSVTVWFWSKMLLVTLVAVWHFLAEYYRKEFLKGRTFKSKLFRIMNEIPTLLLIGIVYLVIFKPFS